MKKIVYFLFLSFISLSFFNQAFALEGITKTYVNPQGWNDETCEFNNINKPCQTLQKSFDLIMENLSNYTNSVMKLVVLPNSSFFTTAGQPTPLLTYDFNDNRYVQYAELGNTILVWTENEEDKWAINQGLNSTYIFNLSFWYRHPPVLTFQHLILNSDSVYGATRIYQSDPTVWSSISFNKSQFNIKQNLWVNDCLNNWSWYCGPYHSAENHLYYKVENSELNFQALRSPSMYNSVNTDGLTRLPNKVKNSIINVNVNWMWTADHYTISTSYILGIHMGCQKKNMSSLTAIESWNCDRTSLEGNLINIHNDVGNGLFGWDGIEGPMTLSLFEHASAGSSVVPWVIKNNKIKIIWTPLKLYSLMDIGWGAWNWRTILQNNSFENIQSIRKISRVNRKTTIVNNSFPTGFQILDDANYTSMTFNNLNFWNSSMRNKTSNDNSWFRIFYDLNLDGKLLPTEVLTNEYCNSANCSDLNTLMNTIYIASDWNYYQ